MENIIKKKNFNDTTKSQLEEIENMKQTQKHNLDIYLKSICDLESLKLISKNCESNYNNKANKDFCTSHHNNYTNCRLIYDKITTAFEERQKEYIKVYMKQY